MYTRISLKNIHTLYTLLLLLLLLTTTSYNNNNNNNNNKMITKNRRNLSLSQEVIDDIDRRTKEDEFIFSNWVEETYIRERMSEKGALIQQKNAEKSAKKWRNLADYLKRKRRKVLKKLSEDQRRELYSAKGVIKRNPDYLNARLRLWNDMFKTNLTKAEYMELLENGN